VQQFRLNDEGKVIDRPPSLRSDNEKEAEAAMRSEMLYQAATYQQLYAQVVEHVRHQILLEHSVHIDDFLPIVQNNPFIPEGREYIYARGLHAGLIGDFLGAAHFIIPQLESSIRYLLTQKGVIPSGLDDQGIQEEYTLGRIIYADEIKTIFGEDIAFDCARSIPQVWTNDRERCERVGLPAKQPFATKPPLARQMLERAFDAQVPAAWVTGDSVYGDDRRLRVWLEERAQAYVLAVSGKEDVWRGWRQHQVQTVLATLPSDGWTRLSAGAGTKGLRW
jgi:hypothetical protein